MKTRTIVDVQPSADTTILLATRDSSRRPGLKTVLWSFLACVAIAAAVNAGTPILQGSTSKHLSIRAAGRGLPNVKLRDGYRTDIEYRGNLAYAAALNLGVARPLALASADFNHSGTPDLVAGYAVANSGVISVQRGNPEAFAPTDESVYARLQQGYEPESLLPMADLYPVPEAPDFLLTGNFSRPSTKDILFASKGGGLYLLKGDGSGKFADPQKIPLPGPVTALAAGEFGAADGFTDIAVGVGTPDGDALLVFDDAARGFVDPIVALPLTAPANAIEFGGLDDDPFQDIAVATGSEVLVIHGWGRAQHLDPLSRIERVEIGAYVRGLAIGEFVWDRAGRSEISALTTDGSVHIIQAADVDTRPFTADELATRTQARLTTARVVTNVESVPSWRPKSERAGWLDASQIRATSFAGVSSVAAKPLLRANISNRESDDLLLIGESQPKLEFVQEVAKMTARDKDHAAATLDRTTLDLESAPIAVLPLPKKLNGTRDFVVLDSTHAAVTVVPQAPNTTITVDRFDDPAGAALTAASACTAAANDCSLRGAIQFANNIANNNTTISLPAGTYVLSINGTNTDGCAYSNGLSSNADGDLGLNQTMSLIGAGAATTIIQQNGTGPANDGDRVMCLAETFPLNIAIGMSALTVVGGRDGASGGTVQVFGGGGIIGGEKGNSLTLTNVVFANNWTVGAGLGGGAVQITGGDLTITNSTFGASNAPGTYANRSSTTTANASGTSGGGISFTPSAPMHTGATGILTVNGSTVINHNTSSSVGGGGGGADVYILAFASPGGIGTGTANFNGNTLFQNNQALGTGSGAGLLNESIPTTVQNTTFLNNSAGNRGGAIYVAGSNLLLDGTTGAITMTGNTAPSGGSSVSTSSAVNVSGTNTTLGGSIEITTNGSWTNNSSGGVPANVVVIAPTDVVMTGGTFNANDSTMNVAGNLLIQPGAVVGSTFNANSGTINIAGNFTFTAGGSSPATTFNAGTSTFNFNGSGAQSISNSASITFNNLTDSNTTNPLTLNNSLAVNGNLNVNGANAILSPLAGTIISGTGTLTGTGTARASRIAATADFLNQYTITNKTLTNLTIDYNGAGNQTVNNTPAYRNLTISGSGTKTLQGNTSITGNLNIAAATFASGNFNFNLNGNWTNSSTFTAGTGTVTFAGSAGTQTLTGNTTFNNLTLNNAGATTNFGTTTTTIGNDLVASAGTMDGGTSTLVFTGAGDNAGSISGAAPKTFWNLQINGPAVISNSAGGDITIENNYSNSGTFNQAAGLTTTFATDNFGDGAHTLSGAGTTTFGNVVINSANTLDAGPHSFNVVGASFNVPGTFTGNTSTVTFNGAIAQSIAGNGSKSFSGLAINNANGVQVSDGTSAVDASVGGLLTLSTDLTVASGAILQQSGSSAGAADVIGTVRRTDLGGSSRAFGNLNNTITINAGTAPTQLDFNLIKSAPATFPGTFKVVPRDITLTPTGGSGISVTLTLRYIDPAELTPTSITESSLAIWKNISGTWTPQGGTLDTTNNFVTLTGVSSFSEWAIAEAGDLTLTKTNSVGGAAVVGQPWNWTLTASKSGAPLTFAAGQTILSDNLPNSGVNYGAVTVQNVSNITGSANISCAIVSNDLTCTASGGSVTFAAGSPSRFDVVFSATAPAVGSFANPRSGGSAVIDPNNSVLESNEGNNTATTNTVTVSKANTTTAVTSSPNPSVFGQSVTFTATVTASAPGAGTPTGTVTFLDGGSSIGTGTLSGGIATFTTSALAVGNHTITASYGSDANFNGSSGSLTGNPQVVNKANTTTAVTSSQNPSVFGQSITFTATLSPVAPGAGTPTGTVTFLDGGSSIGTGTLSGGVATFTTSALAVGNHTITTNFGGDGNFNGSTGSLTGNPQVVNKADTTTAVVSSVNPSVFGQAVTFTATVSPVAPGAGTPTGTVTFLDGGSPIGSGTLSAGIATFTTSALAIGNHTITTSYGASASFNGSTGSLTGNPQVVGKAGTLTTVTSSQNPQSAGLPVTFTATLSAAAPGAGTPTGTVTFLDGGSPIGSGTLSGGVATFTTSALSSGNHTITTNYTGDGNFNGSTGSLTGNPQVITKTPTTTALGTSQGTITLGDTVTFTATVTAGASTAPGIVTFFDGNAPIGSAMLNGVAGNDQAAITTSLLSAAGSPHSITAVYQGTASFASSTSSAIAETVSRRTSTTGVVMSPTTVVVGQSSTATVTVTDSGSVPPGTADTFAATGAPTTGRTGFTTTLVGDGLVLVAGGTDASNSVLKSAQIYSASSGLFSTTGNLNAARTGAVAVLLPNGKVLIAGGSSDGTAGGALNTAELFDQSAGTFTATTQNMGSARSGLTATLLNTGKVLLAGGTNSGGALNSAELYDPSTDTFTATGNLTAARSGASAMLLGTGKVLVAGGSSDGTANGALNSAEIFDPAGNAGAGNFSAVAGANPTLSASRWRAEPAPLLSGKVLVAGGMNSGGALTSADLYDPVADSFTATGEQLSQARAGGTAIPLPSGMVLLAGGTTSQVVDLYDGDSDQFNTTGSLQQSDAGVQSVLLNDGQVLTVGLTAGGSPASDAELYAPSFNPLGAVTVTSSEPTDVIGAACVLSPSTSTASTCTTTITPANVAVSPRTISGNYAADAVHAASSNTASLIVNKSDTATAVTSTANPSVFGQSVTFTATVSPVAPGTGTATGTVTFLDGGSPIGTGTLSGSVATLTTSALAVGNHTITTTYGGDGNFNGSGGSLTGNPQVVDKADSTTTLTSSQNPTVFGQSVMFTATVSPVAPGSGTPTGTVTFLDGGSPIGSGTLSGGVATFATSALSIGDHTITTDYVGDGNFNGSTGSLTGNPQVVNKADSATTVTSSQNPSVFGQGVTFTATVSPVAPGVGTPSGTVTFLDGGSPIGTRTLSGGIATFTTSALAAGNHTITTSYGGDADFNGSPGSLTGNPQVVNAADTTNAVASSQNASVFGQSVTFTATISAVAPGSGTPTGTVTFLDSGSSIGTGTLSGGIATFTTSALTVGNHTITTSYAGDGNFNGSAGSLTGNPQAVNKADTTTAVSSSANPSSFGQSVTFTATVSAVAPGAGAASGTVTFLEGGSSIGTGTLSGGIATFTTSALTVGNHTITTSYGGDGNFNGSTGNLTGNPQVVNKADTTTAIVSSLNPSVIGQGVTFTATVAAVAPGAGTPTGNVTFLDGGNPIASCSGPIALAGGSATCTTSTLTLGNHTITASYAGDGNFKSSNGSMTGNPQVINKPGTTTALTSSQNPSTFGEAVTFTATVTVNAPGSGTATGTVTFLDGVASIGSGTLDGSGVAKLTTSQLAAGNHTISAMYGGDANFSSSTGALPNNPQVVNKADTTTAVTSSVNPSVFGQSLTFIATLAVNAPGAGTPSGTVTFLDGGNSIGTGTLTGGVATFATSSLATGSHTITASYGGDVNFNTSTGSLTGNPQVVNKANTTTTSVTSSANPAVFGQSVTFSATLSAVAPGSGTPSGTVTFLDGGNTLGTGTLNGSGVATFSISSLTIGNHTITVSYGGDGNFNSSAGALTGNPQVIGKASSAAVTILTPSGPITVGSSVQLKATVSAVAPGAGTPTGNVTFLDGAASLGTVPLSSAVATLTVPSFSGGSHSITASYGGDGNFKSTVSPPAILSVTPPTRTITATAGANGSITPSTQYVVDGNTASFTVTPQSGFTAMMSTTCPEGLGTLNNNVYTTRAISQDCSVTATFTSASATLTLTLTDNRTYLHYGLGFNNYIVTLSNSSGSDATGLTISGAETSPSSDLDTASGHWQCFGTATQCLQSGTGPFLDGNVTVPANTSVSWIVSVPRRADPPDDLASYAVTVTGTTPALMQFDTDYFVIFRDTFDNPNADGAESVAPPAAAVEWDGSALPLPATQTASGVITPVVVAVASDQSGFRVEKFAAAAHDWLRVVAVGRDGQEQQSAWVSAEPNALLWLGTTGKRDQRGVILLGGDKELDVPIAASASWKLRGSGQ